MFAGLCVQLQIVEFATGSMTRPEKLVVRLTDTAGPEERGKVDEISAHACINDMSVVCFVPNFCCVLIARVGLLLCPPRWRCTMHFTVLRFKLLT